MDASVTAPTWALALLGMLAVVGLVAWMNVFARMARKLPALPREPRTEVPWGPEGALLAALSVALALTGLLFQEPSADVEPIEEPSTLLQAGMLALYAGTLGAGVALWLRALCGATLIDFGLPESMRQLMRDCGLGALACTTALVPVYAVQVLVVMVFGLPSSHPTLEQLLQDPSLATIIGAVIAAVIVAPLFEEFAFRVLLQGWLERLWGSDSVAPIFTSSLLFAIAHQGQGAAPVALFVFALVLGYLYRQTHRWAPCVVAHMCFNGLSLLMALTVQPA